MKAKEILTWACEGGRELLLDTEVMTLLAEFGIRVPAWKVVSTSGEAVEAAARIGFPVVLKVHSAEVTHKSDIRGVRAALATGEEVKRAGEEILEAVGPIDPQARLSVHQMVPGGIEVIVGARQDVHFGPIIMFGLGGVSAEILEDVAFRMLPIDRAGVGELIRSIRGFPLLDGYRGGPVADLDALEETMVRVSDLMLSLPEVLELDLNPVAALPYGCVALDARARLNVSGPPGRT